MPGDHPHLLPLSDGLWKTRKTARPAHPFSPLPPTGVLYAVPRTAMRIISGTLRSRRLATVEGEGYRPAMGKVRESLFSMLSHRLDWEGLTVLDLYAGSGSLAFEALSRGARAAWLVELSPKAARCIASNIANLGLAGRAFLVQENVTMLLRRVKGADRNVGGPFDLVFVDPPYRRNLTQATLDGLTACGWLAPGAHVVLEVEEGLRLRVPECLETVSERQFGQTTTMVLRLRAEDEDGEEETDGGMNRAADGK